MNFSNIKFIINTLLKPLNLYLLKSNKKYACGIELFSDAKKIIQEDSPLCLDVGANTGQTIDLLLKTFDRPQIHSFEPSIETFKILQKKYLDTSKSNINLHNLALGSSSSTSEMINYENSCLNSLLYLNKRKEENIFHYYNEIKKELVNVETLDNWITQNEVHHIHLLKIDTQGYDFEVLKGSRRCLKQGLIDCIAIEINFIKMYENQACCGDILNFLQDHNMFLVDYYEKIRLENRLGWCTALFMRES
jgi:FkbM family methyltransferase